MANLFNLFYVTNEVNDCSSWSWKTTSITLSQSLHEEQRETARRPLATLVDQERRLNVGLRNAKDAPQILSASEHKDNIHTNFAFSLYRKWRSRYVTDEVLLASGTDKIYVSWKKLLSRAHHPRINTQKLWRNFPLLNARGWHFPRRQF